MNRGERRRRDKTHYDRKAKQLIRYKLIPVNDDEIFDHEHKPYRDKVYHQAENINELEKKSPTLWLYKNTRTPWKETWSKIERKRVNKSSRMNAKVDLKKDPENIQDRPNIKIS